MPLPSIPLPARCIPRHLLRGTHAAHGTGLRRTALSILTAAALAACGGGDDEGPHGVAATQDAAAAAIVAVPPVALVQAMRMPPAAESTAAPASAPAVTGAAAGGPGAARPWRLAVQPADLRVAPGETASFHVRAEGAGGAFEYQWLREGERIEGATASQYGFVTTLDDGGATFSVLVRPRGAGPGHERESAPATLSWRESAG
jgi:hypothetical protein